MTRVRPERLLASLVMLGLIALGVGIDQMLADDEPVVRAPGPCVVLVTEPVNAT